MLFYYKGPYPVDFIHWFTEGAPNPFYAFAVLIYLILVMPGIYVLFHALYANYWERLTKPVLFAITYAFTIGVFMATCAIYFLIWSKIVPFAETTKINLTLVSVFVAAFGLNACMPFIVLNERTVYDSRPWHNMETPLSIMVSLPGHITMVLTIYYNNIPASNCRLLIFILPILNHLIAFGVLRIFFLHTMYDTILLRNAKRTREEELIIGNHFPPSENEEEAAKKKEDEEKEKMEQSEEIKTNVELPSPINSIDAELAKSISIPVVSNSDSNRLVSPFDYQITNSFSASPVTIHSKHVRSNPYFRLFENSPPPTKRANDKE